MRTLLNLHRISTPDTFRVHVVSLTLGRNILTPSQVSDIEDMFGDWLVAHDYELSTGDWLRNNPDPSDCDQVE